MDFTKAETTASRRLMMMMMEKTGNSSQNSVKYEDEDGSEDDEGVITGRVTTEEKKQKKLSSTDSSGSTGKRLVTSPAGGVVICQAETCNTDLVDAKRYHRRHKVCEFHAKAPSVLISGIRQRFCQQCSRFHELSEFDDTKRSCRRRLAGHNERRRKSAVDHNGEGGTSSSKQKGTSPQCRSADQERANRVQIYPGNSGYKDFQIR